MRRISTGGALTWDACGALAEAEAGAEAGRQRLCAGTWSYLDRALPGSIRSATFPG